MSGVPCIGSQEMPVIMLGSWKSEKGKVKAAVRAALEAGYRGFDCANDYLNEPEIGEAFAEAISDGLVRREELFVQCKLWNTNHRHVREDLEASLKDLRLEYVDSYIIHWPMACPSNGKLALAKDGMDGLFPCDADGRNDADRESHFADVWRRMEELHDAGLAKSIGLSNFNMRQVREVLDMARIKPTVLQVESHLYLQQKDLRDFCRINGIVFQAYSPLGANDKSAMPPTGHRVLDDPVIKRIAEARNKSTGQIVLRWHYQMGGAAAPKSVSPDRIRQNIEIFDFELTGDEMAEFNDLNIGFRHLLTPETSGHPDYPFKDELPHDHIVPKVK